ncbi:pentatricopeptide repeat-containing protein DOT4, chloroplastic isoform X3 [Daucus carota subsp. sativus]|uniref:pentatricopeptide repeat-containing protein DOT4, chloroplastic isoform X3 n=1 Tax=Daucus carota subsp. sativus TaxID=79200 RepID=UPI003083B1C8
MAINSSICPKFLEASPHPKLQTRTFCTKTRRVALQLTTQKVHGSTSIKRQISEPTPDCETWQQSQTQVLVDLLHDCAKNRSIRDSGAVHGYILRREVPGEDLLVLLNHVAYSYSKCSDFSVAKLVFDNMPQRNTFSWTVMISGSTENGFLSDGIKYFSKMQENGMLPDKFTYSAIIQLCIGIECIDCGKSVHAQIVKRGFASQTFVSTSLLNMYAKLGQIEDSCRVFNNMEEHSEVSWAALISGLTANNLYYEAFSSFLTMRKEGVAPNTFTVTSVLKAIGMLGDVDKGKQVHKYVSESDAYSKCGSIEDVRKIFDRMEDRDIVSWTTLVNAYSQCSEWRESLAIFLQMREQGFAPNQFTYPVVLASCANLCFLEYGQQVHGLLHKSGFDTDSCVESALIDMYCKCGSIIEAGYIFDGVSNPDVVSWTAMIWGHAQHGSCAYALELFRKMEEMDIEANAVTLLCVLFACSHGGMVEEGLHYFESMEGTYGIVPEMEHYACIVDLLGRVGRLDDALEFIKSMPVKPNEMVWQSLLGACRIYGDVELGNVAAEKILAILPDCSSTYVLLSNTYMEAGNPKGGISLRNMMKERGVKKEPGCSWISVKDRVHKFYARDEGHPQKDDIYVQLEVLSKGIKDMGYVPCLRYALQA